MFFLCHHPFLTSSAPSSKKTSNSNSTFNYNSIQHLTLRRFPLLTLILAYLLNVEHLANGQELNNLQESLLLNNKSNSSDYIQTKRSINNNNVSGIQMQILALFSGTSQDLGIDHRLGRQVLKLAANKAKQLYPELEDIELIVKSDNTPCTNLNMIPSKVVEHIYLSGSSGNGSGSSHEPCGMNSNGKASEIECNNQLDYTNSSVTNKRLRRFFSENKPWIKQVDAIIGPSCDFLVDFIARMAAYWRTPIYSVTSIDASFSRKDIYSTLTRLSPSVDHLSMFILKTMEKFKWRHLAIIIDKSQIENAILSDNLERSIVKMRQSIPFEQQIFPFNSFKESQVQVDVPLAGGNTTTFLLSSSSTASSSTLCTTQAREVLVGARKVARVFLFLLNDQQVIRKLLLCAHELRMNNGEFTFLAVNLNLKSATVQQVTSKNGDQERQEDSTGGSYSVTDSGNSKRVEATPTKLRSTSGRMATQTLDWYSNDDETNNVLAKEMFESLLVFSIELPIGDEYNYFVEETLDMVHREYPGVQFERSSVGSIAVALHDCLLIAVEAHLRNLNNKNNTYNSINLYLKNIQDDDISDKQQTIDDYQRESELYKAKAALLWNEHYSNGLIKAMHINSNGDQEMDYILSDLEPETGAFRPVISYLKGSRQLEFIPSSYIHWPKRRKSDITNEILDSDKPPPDEPECGFNGDAERCIDRQNLYAALLILSVLSILIAISTGISIYKYRHIKYQMQLDDYWWKINWEDLKFVQATDSLASNAQSIARALKSGDGASSILSIENDGSSIVSVIKPKSNSEKLMEIKRQKMSDNKNRQDDVSESVISSKSATKRDSKRRSAVPLIITSEIGSEAKSNVESTTPIGNGLQAASLIAGSCLIRSEYSSVVRASNLAMYRNELVIVKQLNTSKLEVSRELLVELKSIRDLISDNLAKFVGLCLDTDRLSIVYEYCSRGSLRDMLSNTGVSMDWTLKYSIIGDIVNGLNFIHTTLLNYHGRLKSTNLVLDSRFTVKITDFGLQNLYSQLEAIGHQDEDESEISSNEGEGVANNLAPSVTGKSQHYDALSITQSAYNMDSVSVRGQKVSRKETGQERRVLLKNRGAARYFWTAPEHLREKNLHNAGSKKGDVFSLAIIFYEIFTRKEPYIYGTSAKPHWSSVKLDRQDFIQRQRQQQQLVSTVNSVASKMRRRSSRASGDAANQSSVVGSISRQAKRAQGKLKRINASVNPHLEQMERTDSLAGSGSIVSASNASLTSQAEITNPPGDAAPASGRSVVSQSSSARQKPLRLSVAAIDEEREDGAEQDSSGRRSAENTIDAEQILDHIRMGIKPEPIRPYLPNYIIQEVDPKLIELMRACWSEEPSLRPSLSQVRNSLRRITRGIASKNYLDNLLDRLQKYAENLEQIVDAKSSDIVDEKLRTEELLYQLVPKFVADRLKRNEPIIPQVFDGVTIFFSDIVGFEKYASVMSPVELVDLLNNIYSSFDSIISSFDVTKIETIIDQFLVASGISWQQEKRSMTKIQSIEQRQQQQQQSTGGMKRQASLERNKGATVEDDDSNLPDIQESSSSVEGKKLSKRKPFSKSKKLGLLKSLRRSQASIDSKTTNQTGENKRILTKNTSLDCSRTDSMDQQGAPLELVEEGFVSGMKAADSFHYRRNSAEQIARMALCIRDLVKSFHFRQNLSHVSHNSGKDNDKNVEDSESSRRKIGNIVATSFNIRIGMHSGKVCAGIVGVKRPKFCLIGDTVNVASRMHTNSKANKIQISADTKELLEQVPGFNIEARGNIEVKGKGMMETFWLESSY